MTRLTSVRKGDQPKNWRATNPRTGGRRPEDRHFRNAGSVRKARGDQASESGDVWRSRPDGKTQVINEADNEQDEARGRDQQKMSEMPDKERTITTARA